MKLKKYLYLLLLVFTIFSSINVFAQPPSAIDFGQNRVQYKDFKWQFYETENFNIYFYKGGQDLGKYVILNIENIFEDLSKSLDFRLEQKVDILVYNDISDLRQSNIGLETKKQIENGQVKFIDNKLFLYFNGSHKNLDNQMNEGITKIFIEKHVSGAGLRETINNSVAKNLPQWYLTGLTNYNSKAWNAGLENKLKDKILSGRFKDLSKVSEEEMAFVGQSLLHYVENEYSKEAVSNLIYLINIYRSFDRGFRYVTEKNFALIMEEWYYYHLKRFKKERKTFDAINTKNFIPIKIKKNRTVYESKLNPKANSIAYVTNEEGKWKVHIYNLKDSTDKVVFQGGFKTATIKTDLMNPMLAWEPRGSKLTIIYELRDRFFVRDYIVSEEKLDEEVAIRKFQKIYSFSYAENSKNLIMSAMQKGQVDIFKYYLPSTKVTKITTDFYDDLQPSYINVAGYEGYVFISNRQNDTLKKQKLKDVLPNKNFDVFFYDLNSDQQKLVQITNTPLVNESFPQAYNDDGFVYLSSQNGINNQYLASFIKKQSGFNIKYIFTTNENPNVIDSVILTPKQILDSTLEVGQTLNKIISKENIPIIKTYGVSVPNSNYNNSITELSTSPLKKKTLELVLFKNKMRFVLSKFSENTEVNTLKKSGLIRLNESQLKKEIAIVKKETKAIEEAKKDTVLKVFQSKFDDWDEEQDKETYAKMLLPIENSNEESSSAYQLKRTRQYFLKFKADDINISLDNKLLINSYQKYKPNSPVYNNDGLSGFIKFGIKDIFENYRIHGGFRISLDSSSLIPKEFYVTYENLTKRLDQEITFYRNSISNDINRYNGTPLQQTGEEVTHTNYLHLKLKYPLDILNSVRLKMAVRNENTVTKSTESITLNTNNLVENWAILKLEFVHDNTIVKAKNILNGFRANGYFEFQKEIPSKEVKIIGEDVLLPSWNDGYLVVFGADARHYLKVFNTVTWANRVAFSSSLGTRKVLYFLGGSDGQLFPGFNSKNEVDDSQNYAFQSLAQNMRGMPQNTRNGNSYFVINSEFRVPIFSAFSKKSMKSRFMESIQLVAFVDIGSAWEGITPWSDDNIYTEIRTNRPDKPSDATSIVKLQIFKDPFVVAFGPGVRANIFNYFFRFDLGWAYDTGEIQSPKMHVSMTYDF